ncbi:MAG: recombinase RecT [Oscillospiraceae bacterium]|nr:recombinase RecT [Oscillospiraceae bacterium]
MNNQIQPKPQKARFSVAITTPQYQKLISSTLCDPNRVRSFTAAITSAVAVNPALQDCEASSIIAGALLGESLNLSPSPQLGQYYLVPFECQLKDSNGKKMWELDDNGQPRKNEKGKWIPISVKNATFVLGYRGYIQLAIRSGYYLDIDSIEIREGEYKGRDRNTGKPVFEFIEDDALREALPVIGYMAYFEYLNGFKKTLYWSKEKMMQHANTYSAAFSAADYTRLQNNEIPADEMWKYSSYWYKSFDDMAKKTMLRQLVSKWGVMSSAMQSAYDSDSYAIKSNNGSLIPEKADEPEPQEQFTEYPEAAQPTESAGPKKINISDV